MKLLLLNQDWFAEELRELGHEVLTLGAHGTHFDVKASCSMLHIHTVMKQHCPQFAPDRLIIFDNSSPVCYAGLEELDIPTLFYAVDTHQHLDLHLYSYELFDEVLVAQRDYIPEFHRLGYSPEWMPLWASRVLEPTMDKSHGAVFVGTMNARLNPDRVKFIEALAACSALEVLSNNDFSVIFPRSEVVVNQTAKRDLNFRIFEAMVSGAALLTERIENGLPELFREGTELVLYERGNVAEAASKIAELLSDTARSRAIGRAGRERILQEHLPRHRAARLDRVVSAMERKSLPGRFFAGMVNFEGLAARASQVQEPCVGFALIWALRAAEQALRRGEKLNFGSSCALVGACINYDLLTKSGSGEKLLNVAAEAHPDMPLLRLAQIKLHMLRGERDAARAIARLIREDAEEELYQASDQIISQILSTWESRG